ncbi:uromodulin-like 1 [Puntigrus tetrazona]|uniref:uromodulin-like 1 n=1 Tax=Puntigrus tetrazona TaxID=1606681 RepID=UPI001C8A87FD|nr:uromodulin-like 1 [Puntigrus tetrazona]
MHWVVGIWLIVSLLGLGMGHNTLFEGYDRTLSGYHLCNMTESVSETHVVPYTTSYTQRKPCGGWLPWAMCDVTVYKTEYRTQVYDMPKQVMKCCRGYEQVGSYCALSLNRSAEFTSKPGLCPPPRERGSRCNNSDSSGSVCNRDIDCPQWQKCCLIENTSPISQCLDPVPSVNRTWCFNVTITVKTTYELVTRDKGLFNHTRLLHSVVTGALGTDQISVHHIWSKSAGPFTTSSSLLVCSPKAILLADISAKLYLLGIIEEVTNVVVQDVDECVPQLNSCSPHASCRNTEGSYTCTCLPGYQDLNLSQPGTVCTVSSATAQPTPPTTTSITTHSPPDNKTDRGQTSPSSASTVETSSFSQTFSTCGVAYQDQDHSKMCNFITQHNATDVASFEEVGNWCFREFGSTFDRPHYCRPRVTIPATSASSPPDYTPVIISILSYNVTASSFHVAWTTDIQTGVTFDLILLNGSKEIQNFVVKSYNLTFTDLSPAVLHTLRVTPVACGKQGNPTEIKVRTDGLSLGASARLKGVNYTEAMKDPNSDEYKKFCNSVINEILSSLPSKIHALVVSGQVIIQITSLSSGSVIVNFSIIFQPGSSMNILSVSSALMGSLQNSSTYVVDGNSIYITDADECFLDKADCSPWAYCNNTFGSYTCVCWSGYTDLNPSRPGRSCAAIIHPTTNHPGVPSDSTGPTSSTTIFGNSTMSSTVSTTHVQHNTTTFSTSTAANGPRTVMPNAPTTTLSPMKQNSLKTTTFGYQTLNSPPHFLPYVAVECIPGFLTVVVRRDFLHNYNIQESSLYLGTPECGLSRENATHVWLTTSWDTCGTKLAHNNTHNLANVTLYNSVSNVFTVRLEVPVICSYPRGVLISTGYAPSGYVDMINYPVAGSGSFQVTVRLMNGTIPLPADYSLSPDDEITVEVGVNTTISQIKVVIEKCWATSSSDSSEYPYYLFQEQGCLVTNPYTTVRQNGNDTVALISVRIFKVVNLYTIYLHCQIQICVEVQDGTCKPSCMRTFRSSNIAGVKQATVGPIKRIPSSKFFSDTSSTLQTVGFILLGVGVFVFSLAAVAGLAYHKRKIGNYNFRCKPQQQNFTYHVFDT